MLVPTCWLLLGSWPSVQLLVFHLQLLQLLQLLLALARHDERSQLRHGEGQRRSVGRRGCPLELRVAQLPRREAALNQRYLSCADEKTDGDGC